MVSTWCFHTLKPCSTIPSQGRTTMDTREKAAKHPSSPLFLAEPTVILALDSWIAHYQQQRKRFTLREAGVLAGIWQQGEDIRLREDRCFQQTPHASSADEAHWYLAIHTLANESLYEDRWDGHDLSQQLEQCDKKPENAYHVFDLHHAILRESVTPRSFRDLYAQLSPAASQAEQCYKSVAFSPHRQNLPLINHRSNGD
jgi:hypothetical protein